MALFEIVDEIAQKQVEKTETGDNRLYGVTVGIVTKNYDKDMPGRVCVQIISRDDKANELLWARVAQPSSGSKWGHYFLPEVGDQVLVAFEGGNIERPYIIGCIPKATDKFLKDSADENNQFKKIISTHGNTLLMTDQKDDKDGNKDNIMLHTATQAHKLIMDNDKKFITLANKNEKNGMKITTEDGKGTIEIKTEQKLTIKVGDNITVTMNGSNGTVEINATKINLKATGDIQLEATKNLTMSGAASSLKGNSNVKIESTGAFSASGTPIKLG
ncbi:MAG: phage baseplate assembly protein V [Lachnospiraceae bacterium]|nr:phage baseplate assembly protein V [Lachnospiraceae bacterium]